MLEWCMWLGVDLSRDTKKTCVQKRLDNVLKDMLTTLGLVVNMIGETYMVT